MQLSCVAYAQFEYKPKRARFAEKQATKTAKRDVKWTAKKAEKAN